MRGIRFTKQVAEAFLRVYNDYILRYYIPFKTVLFTSLVAGLLCAAALLSVTSYAQSPLQNTNTNSSLQPQSTPTQDSANTQNQVGTLQNNNSSGVLNQTGNRPLGVVSGPNQSTPTTVVNPSNTTKAEIAELENDSNLPRILLALAALVIAAVGVLILRRLSSNEDRPVAPTYNVVSEKPVIKPEPLPVITPKKSRKQQRRKKKKQASRR